MTGGVAQAQQLLRQMESAIGSIGLTLPVIRRASMPMATVVKTLDAIHLASAQLFTENQNVQPVFVTHDETQALAARALGFDVEGAA